MILIRCVNCVGLFFLSEYIYTYIPIQMYVGYFKWHLLIILVSSAKHERTLLNQIENRIKSNKYVIYNFLLLSCTEKCNNDLSRANLKQTHY